MPLGPDFKTSFNVDSVKSPSSPELGSKGAVESPRPKLPNAEDLNSHGPTRMELLSKKRISKDGITTSNQSSIPVSARKISLVASSDDTFSDYLHQIEKYSR